MAAVLVFGLAAVVFAYNQSQNHSPAAASHCRMHKQNGSTVAAATDADRHKDSCCGMADCCKDGKCSMGGSCCGGGKKDKDSCPMKQHDAQQTNATESVDMTNVVVVGDSGSGGENCCQPGADCCTKGGSCCHRKKS